MTEDQYKNSIPHVGHAFDDPWLPSSMHAEGAIEYTGLIFVPSERPFDLFDPDRKQRLKLYVKGCSSPTTAEAGSPSYCAS